jgi:hypothetical protein
MAPEFSLKCTAGDTAFTVPAMDCLQDPPAASSQYPSHPRSEGINPFTIRMRQCKWVRGFQPKFGQAAAPVARKVAVGKPYVLLRIMPHLHSSLLAHLMPSCVTRITFSARSFRIRAPE